MCRWCAGPLQVPYADCGRARCRRATREEKRRAEFVEEYEHLRGTDTPESIAARLGCASVESMCKRLERAGRNDLSRPLSSYLAVVPVAA
jgi:hypothetical protein